MARYWIGGGPSDYTIAFGDTVTISTPGGDIDGKTAVVVGGIDITFWNDESTGTRYTDLRDRDGLAVSSVLSSDTGDGRNLGQIPRLQLPDGVRGAWASANGGPRVWMAADLSEEVAATTEQAGRTAADLRSHLDAPNPHQMASNDLTDWSPDTPLDGQVGVYRADLGQYVPTTVEGLDPDAFVKSAGGSRIDIPVGDIATRALGVYLPPGDRSAAPNTIEVWWNAGSEGSPNWVLVTRISPYGEFRGRPSRSDRVYGQVAQAPGQTANLWEFTDPEGNRLSWVDAAGRFRAPNSGIPIGPWFQDTGVGGTGTYRFANPTGGPLTIRGFVISVGGTAPAGGDYVIEPKLDGVPLYTSANRPKVPAGQRTSGLVTNLTTTTWPAGSYITVDVFSVPSTPPTKVTIQGLAY
ncbi:hypothetical protein ABZY58_11820 [Micromonospora tulbaghiae]|uniref:hypothetical protein n=1 Tax=Micromonospora tulbaghiae TaxID=479978 RepID=UPI0033BD8E75